MQEHGSEVLVLARQMVLPAGVEVNARLKQKQRG
jgi:hypothetical protein